MLLVRWYNNVTIYVATSLRNFNYPGGYRQAIKNSKQMKRLVIMLGVISQFVLCVTVSSQEYSVVVNQSDGSKYIVQINNVDSITFEKSEYFSWNEGLFVSETAC